MRSSTPQITLLLALALSACNAGSDLLVPELPPPDLSPHPWTFTVVQRAAGPLVAGTASAPLGEVVVTDAYGVPVPDAWVSVHHWEGPRQYETFVEGHADEAGVFPLPTFVDTLAGRYVLRPVGFQDVVPTPIVLTVLPAAPATIRLLGATEFLGRTWQGGVIFGVTDRYQNRIPGLQVSMSVVSGGGTIQVENGGITDSLGQASAMVFASPLLDTTLVRATIAELPDSVAEAGIRTVALPITLAVSGDSQSVAPGRVPSLPWRVRIVDSAGVGIAAMWVGIGVPGTSQSFPVKTDADGYATLTPPAAPLAPGWYGYTIINPVDIGSGRIIPPSFQVRVVALGEAPVPPT